MPALADGGPHQLAINNGTSGLSGDCAACHRAHTAQAADLLKQAMPGLCLTCHDGNGATTDVADGYQYVPNGSGNPTGTVLGALRGGGFDYSLIDSASAVRMSIGGTQTVTMTGVPTGGSFTLHTPFGDTIVSAGATAASVQTALQGLYGTSTTYTGSTAAGNMSSTPANNGNVTVSLNTAATVYTITFQNALRLAPQTLITVSAQSLTNAGGAVTVTTADTTQSAVRQTAALPALASTAKVATSSNHEGAGTVWGNGAQGSGTVGATGVALECTNCHNPHGNGQYRILQTTPGSDWANGTNGVAGWTASANAVEVADATPATLTAGQVRNYTVKAGALTTDVSASGTGDYWRYKYDPSGAANWTNFYLKTDQMNTGWNGAAATNKAANGGVAPANTSGLMTAWCITCHTRYNGYSVDPATGLLSTAASGTSPSSLAAQAPTDSEFMYKHGTTRIGCEQCHVSHGTSAAMTAQFSSAVTFPDGSAEDSALLKLPNRGTCNMCHDPTGTVTPGTVAGASSTVPASVTDKY